MKRSKQLERCKFSADRQIKIIKRNIKKDEIVLVEANIDEIDFILTTEVLASIHKKFNQMDIKNYIMIPSSVSISTVGLNYLINIRNGIDIKIKELIEDNNE